MLRCRRHSWQQAMESTAPISEPVYVVKRVYFFIWGISMLVVVTALVYTSLSLHLSSLAQRDRIDKLTNVSGILESSSGRQLGLQAASQDQYLAAIVQNAERFAKLLDRDQLQHATLVDTLLTSRQWIGSLFDRLINGTEVRHGETIHRDDMLARTFTSALDHLRKAITVQIDIVKDTLRNKCEHRPCMPLKLEYSGHLLSTCSKLGNLTTEYRIDQAIFEPQEYELIQQVLCYWHVESDRWRNNRVDHRENLEQRARMLLQCHRIIVPYQRTRD
ncbi:MAG TPA: hypothetical protein VM260_26935 [Pirellula sp.]|nr:hypothetical protein [Pirellula sp.]